MIFVSSVLNEFIILKKSSKMSDMNEFFSNLIIDVNFFFLCYRNVFKNEINIFENNYEFN